MIIYFAGQDNFGNRGCEALIRSSVEIIQEKFPDAQFLVPSLRPDLDSKQWPEASERGVRFVSPEPFPAAIRWWGRLTRRVRFLPFWEPRFQPTKTTQKLMRQSDVVIMTGGDIISFDYGLESLYYWAGLCRASSSMGKTTILWAASVGPFHNQPAVEGNMVEFLKMFDLITVREDTSLQYLEKLGVPGVVRASDPAFCLAPQTSGIPEELLRTRSGFRKLGFNISPVIRKFRHGEAAKIALDKEVADFLTEAANIHKCDITLIPHVDPLDMSGGYNSDSEYMHQIFEKVRHNLNSLGGHISMAPSNLNAAQLKHVISTCDSFIGGRTHATIAALSTGVPTISIAYSIKAQGINDDVFGHHRYVLPTPEVSKASLLSSLKILELEHDAIKRHLTEAKPRLQHAARESVRILDQKILRAAQQAA